MPTVRPQVNLCTLIPLFSFLTNLWRIEYLPIKSRYFTLIKLIISNCNQYLVKHGYSQVILVNIDISLNWRNVFNELKYF